MSKFDPSREAEKLTEYRKGYRDALRHIEQWAKSEGEFYDRILRK